MAFVTKPTNDLLLTFTDRSGKYATVRYHVDASETDPSAGGASDLRTKTAACSDLLLTKAEVLRYAVDDAPAAAGSGPFDRVTDKLRLRFTDDNNVGAVIELASLKEAVMMPDGVTVDQANALIIALRDALFAVGTTAEGQPLTFFKGGKRVRNKGIKVQ